MEIKQIIGVKDMIYGLGVDNKVYQWNYSKTEWTPYFATGEKKEPAQVFYPRQVGGNTSSR